MAPEKILDYYFEIIRGEEVEGDGADFEDLVVEIEYYEQVW